MGKDSPALRKYFDDFYENYCDILWAAFLVKMKFAKIIELMVMLDRVIYLLEGTGTECEDESDLDVVDSEDFKKIKNVELVEIFEREKSKRNYLIYANKN